MIFVAAIITIVPSLCTAFMPPASSVLSRHAPCDSILKEASIGAVSHKNHWISSSSSHHVSLLRRQHSVSPTMLRMGLLDMFKSEESSSSKTRQNKDYKLQILDEVGSGSYGTVHLCQLIPKSENAPQQQQQQQQSHQYRIAKRAWTQSELLELAKAAAQSATESIEADLSSTGPHKQALKSRAEAMTDEERIRDRAGRCRYYLDVERHCLEKLCSGEDREYGDAAARDHVPKLVGTYPDEDKRDWLVFDLIERRTSSSSSSKDSVNPGDAPTPALALSDILEQDWIDQHRQDDGDPNAHHHLSLLQKELGMDEGATFADTLDRVFVELLRAVSAVNEANIVHRDVKPGNLLVTSGGGGERGGASGGGFVLIDFGSAADIDPPANGNAASAFSSAIGGGGGRVGLDDEGRVALSPIYAAPEMFVRWDRAPMNFDSFSTALVFAQLLFNLLDERADASFRQQLEDCDFNLDACLQRKLSGELLPDGIEDAALYLGERPGMWAVIRDMLHPNPERRLSTSEALGRVEDILAGCREGRVADREEADGKFFAGVVESLELCEMPESGSVIGVASVEDGTESSATSTAEQALVIPRPLHYVATFSRSESLGLLLSEVDPNGAYDDDLSEEDTQAWEEATTNANPGEVYVRGVVEGGQAEKIGVFEVGDRLHGVGEFPFLAEGFSTVVEMLQRQPPTAKSVTLHFDRKSVGRAHAYERTEAHLAKVVGQGAWSARGRRKTQEDRFSELPGEGHA
mmetsp:Transcript_27685/g.55955  ORF Transcript_27685/g.55955 Transcript_27685/m.55955 type:complete len:748 (+) Transcript_27685:459-2702(+)